MANTGAEHGGRELTGKVGLLTGRNSDIGFRIHGAFRGQTYAAGKGAMTAVIQGLALQRGAMRDSGHHTEDTFVVNGGYTLAFSSSDFVAA